MPKKITQRQVARLAQVSIPTVSRVLNRSAHVSPDIEQRVRDAARQLNFPMAGAEARRVVAFLLANRAITHPFHSEVMAGAEACCAEHDYYMLFCTLRYGLRLPVDQLPAPRLLGRRGTVDGYIVAGVNSASLLPVLRQTGLPLSVFATTMVEDHLTGYPTVRVDESGGAVEATRHLQELGHTAIWFVGNTRSPWLRRRYEAYSLAMREAGLTPLLSEFDSDDEQQAGYLAARSILDRGASVTAIFAANDRTAHGVYDALRDRNIPVGEGISVVGFNDTLEAIILHPALTSVRVHAEQVGRQLAEMVLRQIEGHPAGSDSVTIPVRLIKRESTRPLRMPGSVAL